MGIETRIEDLANRLGSYALWEVLVELVLIWIIVYAAIRFLQGTRAARAVKGLLVVLVLGTLVVRVMGGDTLGRLAYLYDRLLAVIALALVVIFQPELRRALIRLGETRLIGTAKHGAEFVAGELAPACVFLSKAKFGAIIVVERRVGLKSIIEGGTPIDAELSGALVQTIFHPGSALHDLAVVIKGDRIQSAGVQLPMVSASEFDDAAVLGSRHRAAVGVTKETDALVLVVSEETGEIRLAERGVLIGPIEREALEAMVRERLGHDPEVPSDAPPLAPSGGGDTVEGFVADTEPVGGQASGTTSSGTKGEGKKAAGKKEAGAAAEDASSGSSSGASGDGSRKEAS